MADPVTSSGMEHIKTHQNQNVKAKQLLDGVGRVQFLIVAAANAKHADPAHRTEYIYNSPTSAFIIAWKETNTSWDSAYDVDFTT